LFIYAPFLSVKSFLFENRFMTAFSPLRNNSACCFAKYENPTQFQLESRTAEDDVSQASDGPSRITTDIPQGAKIVPSKNAPFLKKSY